MLRSLWFVSSVCKRRTSYGILFTLLSSTKGSDGFSTSRHQGNMYHRHNNIGLQNRRIVLQSQQLSIVEDIRQAFQEEQTDGIIKLQNCGPNVQIDELVSATMEAVDENSGHVASIMNGYIGACSLLDDKRLATSRVCDLLEAYDELDEDKGITPDIVTYSLAYNALSLDPDARDLAEIVLDRAIKLSKKKAGGKRRKALAASRRKKSFTSCTLVETKLKELLGDDFQVLQETDSYVVINKPSGVSCFHKKKTTAGKIKKGKGKKTQVSSDISLEDAFLTCNVPLSTLNHECMGLVHRLDRGTSGCMVLAKTDETHANLLSEFFLRKTEKKYLTIVTPAPDSSLSDEGCIDVPVDARPAKSKYEVIERYGESTAALLSFDIYTGRKHQVRVHAAEGLSAAVLFDDVYAPKDIKPTLPDDLLDMDIGKSKFFLHASRLKIPEYEIDTEAPIPSWWESIISMLKHQ